MRTKEAGTGQVEAALRKEIEHQRKPTREVGDVDPVVCGGLVEAEHTGAVIEHR